MLPKDVLDTVVFIYDGEAAAKDPTHKHHSFGGTGWLVGVPYATNPSIGHLFVVTNKHVINTTRFPVVRVNMRDGGFDLFSFDQSDWHIHESADLAIHRIELSPEHQAKCNSADTFLTNDHVEKYAFGVGDSVFSIGRFVNLTGQQQNRQVVRFGRVALMPPAKIDNEDLLLVEMRSRTGYSGSPLWIYIDPTSSRWARGTENPMKEIGGPSIGPFIIGTHTKQLYGVGPDDDENDNARGAQTGMTAIVPIEKLTELLDMKEVKDEREQFERDNPPQGDPESAAIEAEDESDAKRDDVLKTMLDTPPKPRK